jgi:homogentisate 1,2-dioxygenase
VGEGSMAFMFETCYMMKVTEHSMEKENRDLTYVEDSWSNLKKKFDPSKKNITG